MLGELDRLSQTKRSKTPHKPLQVIETFTDFPTTEPKHQIALIPATKHVLLDKKYGLQINDSYLWETLAFYADHANQDVLLEDLSESLPGRDPLKSTVDLSKVVTGKTGITIMNPLERDGEIYGYRLEAVISREKEYRIGQRKDLAPLRYRFHTEERKALFDLLRYAEPESPVDIASLAKLIPNRRLLEKALHSIRKTLNSNGWELVAAHNKSGEENYIVLPKKQASKAESLKRGEPVPVTYDKEKRQLKIKNNTRTIRTYKNQEENNFWQVVDYLATNSQKQIPFGKLQRFLGEMDPEVLLDTIRRVQTMFRDLSGQRMVFVKNGSLYLNALVTQIEQESIYTQQEALRFLQAQTTSVQRKRGVQPLVRASKDNPVDFGSLEKILGKQTSSFIKKIGLELRRADCELVKIKSGRKAFYYITTKSGQELTPPDPESNSTEEPTRPTTISGNGKISLEDIREVIASRSELALYDILEEAYQGSIPLSLYEMHALFCQKAGRTIDLAQFEVVRDRVQNLLANYGFILGVVLPDGEETNYYLVGTPRKDFQRRKRMLNGKLGPEERLQEVKKIILGEEDAGRVPSFSALIEAEQPVHPNFPFGPQEEIGPNIFNNEELQNRLGMDLAHLFLKTATIPGAPKLDTNLLAVLNTIGHEKDRTLVESYVGEEIRREFVFECALRGILEALSSDGEGKEAEIRRLVQRVTKNPRERIRLDQLFKTIGGYFGIDLSKSPTIQTYLKMMRLLNQTRGTK